MTFALDTAWRNKRNDPMTILNWQRSVEQIALSNERYRTIGFTSVRGGAGVSVISRLLAKAYANNGSATLLVDMSGSYAAQSVGVQSASSATLRGCIVKSQHEFDLLSGTVLEDHRACANLQKLRETLLHDFQDYKHVVLDLPPIHEINDGSLNTVAAAAICDRLFLVCAIGQDCQSEVSEVLSILRDSGVPLAGIVSNEYMRVDAREKFLHWGPLRLLRS
jgi:Mrp family chromosome partitioning ATPase